MNKTMIPEWTMADRLRKALDASGVTIGENAPDVNGGRWAPDPYGRFHTRYWDGTAWTQWVGDKQGGQSSDPPG